MGFLKEYQGSSFLSLLKTDHPELMPKCDGSAAHLPLVHGTTIVAVKFAGGVLLGGDRRATIDGHIVMNEDVTKVFKIDDSSAMAIAGTFGPSIKMVKLFQLEIEHYEKIEGVRLTLDGRANKLSLMVEMNLAAAMQGLVVMPLYVGFDPADGQGRIFEYDVTGGMFVKTAAEGYSTSGSGGDRARSTFEHFWREDLIEADAIGLIEKALAFAAKRDTATGGKSSIIMSVTPRGVETVRGGEAS